MVKQVQMHINIYEYIKKSRDERLSHLQLDEPCIKIGGKYSTEYRGLLAYFLKTTLPEKKDKIRIDLCHGCNNPACSNVYHLYWGTAKDNMQDQIESGVWKSHHERVESKYGKAVHMEMLKDAGRKGGLRSRRSLDKETIERYRSAIISSEPEKWGWIARVQKSVKLSHTQIRRFTERYCSDLNVFKR